MHARVASSYTGIDYIHQKLSSSCPILMRRECNTLINQLGNHARYWSMYYCEMWRCACAAKCELHQLLLSTATSSAATSQAMASCSWAGKKGGWETVAPLI